MDQLLPTPAHIPRPCRIPTIILPRLMVCVQQVVGPLPQRLSQILVVQLLDIRVLVGVSNFCLCVQLPQLLASRRGHLNALMDGLTAAANIRHLSNQDASTIPIIAMTANAFDEDIEKSRAAGMDAHLAKPIDPGRMYQTLYDFIDMASE